MDDIPIIDTHIHLFPTSELETLAWCKPGHPLWKQCSVQDYLSAIHSPPKLRGFVFIEADRKSHLESDEGWKHPLAEVDWARRIADGTPKQGEGHAKEHADLCLAIVPWAPVPAGATTLARYVDQVRAKAGRISDRIAGFRYLVQDKPASTMLQANFIEGLRWLGGKGYLFELAIDQRSGGLWQLDEAISMISKANEGVAENDQVTIVINHMCKPDMQSPCKNALAVQKDQGFQEWAKRIDVLASFPNTYIKVSGSLSEIQPLPPQDKQETMDFWTRSRMLADIEVYIENWLAHVASSFGPRRIMFGSDWPVCNIGGGGNRVAWMKWWRIVRTFAARRIDPDDWEALWGGTAAKVYKIARTT